MNPFKFPWTLTIAVLFVTVSLARSQLFYHGRRLRISPKECSSSSRRFESLSGVCMFNLECQEKSGTVIGACVDQFLFGACCHIPNYTPSLFQQSLEDDSLERTEHPSRPTVTTTAATGSDAASTVKIGNQVISNFNSTSSAAFLQNLYNVTFNDDGSSASATTLQPNNLGPRNYSRYSVEGTTESVLPNSERFSPTAKSTSTSASAEFYPTRFHSRPRPTGLPHHSSDRIPADSDLDETNGALHRTHIPLSVGKHSTPPSPSASGSFLPLTLETFSSVSDPVTNGVHGGDAHVHNANGQSHLAVEPTSLTLVTIVNSNSDKHSKESISNTVSIIKRTSSSGSISDSDIIINRPNSNNKPKRPAIHSSSGSVTTISELNGKLSSLLQRTTTLSPPKLSTFLYVDGDLVPQQPEEDTTSNSITDHFSPETTETDANEDVVTITEQLNGGEGTGQMTGNMSPLPEDLNSNTENVWSVVMQLGPHGTNDPKKPPEVSSGEADNDFSHLPIIASTLHSSGLTGSTATSNSHKYSPMGPNALPLLASVLEAADAEEDFWRTTLGSVDKEVSQDLRVEQIPPVVIGGTGISKSRPRPANDDGVGLSEIIIRNNNKKNDDDDEMESTEMDRVTVSTPKPWASSTYMIHTFQYPDNNQTYSSEEDSEETTSYSSNFEKLKNSSMLMENGLMTWLSVDLHNNEVTTTEKDGPTQLPSANDMMKEDDSAQEMLELAEGLKHSTVFQKEQLITKGTRPTTPSTTITTTKQPTTKRVTTTTTTSTTPKPTTTTTPSTTTESTTRLPSRATTTKWKRPSTYTISPEKKYRPTTTTTTTTPEPPKKTTPVRRIGIAGTTPKPPKLITKAPYTTSSTTVKSTTPLLLAEDDIDTNLDYLVDQVVQNMAESLSGSDLDDVIKHPSNYDSSSSSAVTSRPDTKLPPFPLKDVHQLIKGKKPSKLQTTKRPQTTTHRTLDYRKDCGVRMLKKSGRIVGGTASKFGQWPWQALVKEATWLGLFSKNKCGGVLIAPKYVLTAAHCQPGFLATLTVVLGDFDISNGKDKSSSQSVTKNVRRVIVHRDYNAQTFENDIALLELESPVEYAPHIVPICLPEDLEDFVGQQAFVTGWGRLKYGGGVPQILHEVDVPVLTNDNCQEMFQKSGHLKAIRESFICAGYAEGLKDSCEGDSGGPLSVKRPTGQWVLAGTVSHGIKCAYPNLPGVYMRMTFYKPWIKKVTGMKG